MDENEDLSNQLNLLLGQSNDQQQENHFPLYNSNITSTNNNDLYSNMFACDQQYLQPLAPVNNTALRPATGNNNPILMPPESLPLRYHNTNTILSHASLHPAYYFDAGGIDPLDPNWEAINAFLAGRVRPGADTTQVYRCGVCNAEFVSPQAQGGHMSSHSRKRNDKVNKT